MSTALDSARPTPIGTSDGEVPRGHPRGLYLLFFTEMWERMSYYGMRALLVLYMTRATTEGGFGWSKSEALSIYGSYTGLVYLTPLFGGWLADRYLGQRRAVFIGGALMVAGHFLMAVPGSFAFFAALGLLIAGNGFFKPNISTMVGGLYKEGDARRDGGFTIFYMGINIGAFLSPLICGTLGEKVGFHWGFGSAGVGMLLGQIIYMWGGNRFLGDLGKRPGGARQSDTKGQAERKPLTKEEVDRITVILVLACFTIFFWAAFEQAGGLMNLYTDEKVNRMLLGWEVPTTWFQSLNPAFIVLLGPIFAMLWVRLGKRGMDPSTPLKFAFALVALALGFVLMVFAAKESASLGKANMGWVVGAYLFHTIGELCLSPVGLSMVTKLAPLRYGSMMMGVWFFSNSVADKLSGTIGAYAEHLGEVQLFGAIAVATSVAGVVLFLIARPLNRRMHGVH